MAIRLNVCYDKAGGKASIIVCEKRKRDIDFINLCYHLDVDERLLL